ncbi:MAG: type II toxin-antitoxin system mRNA interferase toxin, RelE/StbE family [Candidatus Coatesbacteria bacterium]|nr:MAG: type II toxin-antitoxin system mRNA interferase toxin, RelE/StbE family [Candidatus Coatesbacteria bacterium]
MTAYSVLLTPEAKTDIQHLDAAVRSRILTKIEWMSRNAELLIHHPLRGERFSGCFKYRFGDYRIIYQLRPTKRQISY